MFVYIYLYINIIALLIRFKLREISKSFAEFLTTFPNFNCLIHTAGNDIRMRFVKI